jgi:hypothetical protein
MIRRTIRALIVIVCSLLLTAAVLVNMGAHNYHGFMNFMRMGWFSFVLGRIVALFLVVLALRRLWQWSRAVGMSLAGLVIIGLTAFSVIKSYSPAGVYGLVPGLNDDMDHYFRLAGGKVDLIHDFPRLHGDYGHYEKTIDGWFLTYGGKDPSVCRLKFSVLGIYLIDVESGAHRFLPRRIIPFLRPGWMPDWFQ